jgi:hypothetical protein
MTNRSPANPDVRCASVCSQGFLVVEITRAAIICDHVKVAEIGARTGRAGRVCRIVTTLSGEMSVFPEAGKPL